MMRRSPFVIAALLAGSTLFAQDATPAVEPAEQAPAAPNIFMPDASNLSDFKWVARPIVVFADSPNDPRFAQQISLLAERADALAERDVVVLTDTDPEAAGPLRKELRPRGFMIALIAKDGGVELRKASPWDVRELTRTIDKMLLRQREVRERRITE